RSGTTLLEEILASHPKVGTAGELRFLADHAPRVPDTGPPDASTIQEIGRQYVRRLELADPRADRVIDKMPTNLMNAGLAHILLPNARIVYCRRNPLDNCLSLFVTALDGPSPFLHSASNIAFLWRQQMRLFEHWSKVLPPDRFTVVDYEALVEDREPILRRLLDFVGLEWDEACMAHGRTNRMITTPSQWQARQGIYKTSVERWRRYQPWIEELWEAAPELRP
ncbi:MAG TPA: sulfotransferase, partial [Fimbriimonadaceae bacterium]|nr:sulfotransferase [Fimbriimonadaceae bacterium]